MICCGEFTQHHAAICSGICPMNTQNHIPRTRSSIRRKLPPATSAGINQGGVIHSLLPKSVQAVAITTVFTGQLESPCRYCRIGSSNCPKNNSVVCLSIVCQGPCAPLHAKLSAKYPNLFVLIPSCKPENMGTFPLLPIGIASFILSSGLNRSPRCTISSVYFSPRLFSKSSHSLHSRCFHICF